MPLKIQKTRLIQTVTGLVPVVVLISLCFGSNPLGGQVNFDAHEWPKWGGPNGNFIVDSLPLADSWPQEGPKELWNRPLGSGHSAILVGGGQLFTMYRIAHGVGGTGPFEPSETVIALDINTGATLWEYSYASKVQDFSQGAGPHATPLLENGRLFTVGTNKELYAFDPKTGHIHWSRNLVEDFDAPPLLIRSMVKPGYGVSPIPYEDTIIMQVGGPDQSVVALRQSDGEVVWKSGSFLVSHAPAGLINVDGERQLIIFAGQAVHGLNPDTGKILWAHPHDAGNDFNFQIPLWGNNLLFLSSGYIGGSRTIQLKREGGLTHVEELWVNPRLRFTFLNPIRLGDVVYGTSGQTGTAIMSATHVMTGETLWRARGFSRSSLVQADGKTIVLQEDGKLSLVKLAPSGINTLAEMQLFDTTSWTAPTLVGSTLYARDRQRIVALDLASR